MEAESHWAKVQILARYFSHMEAPEEMRSRQIRSIQVQPQHSGYKLLKLWGLTPPQPCSGELLLVARSYENCERGKELALK